MFLWLVSIKKKYKVYYFQFYNMKCRIFLLQLCFKIKKKKLLVILKVNKNIEMSNNS